MKGWRYLPVAEEEHVDEHIPSTKPSRYERPSDTDENPTNVRATSVAAATLLVMCTGKVLATALDVPVATINKP